MKFCFFFVFKPWKCGPTPFLLFWLIRKIYIFIEALGNCESLTFFRLTSAHLSYLSDIFGKRKVTRRQFEKQEASPEMPSSILKWDLCRKKETSPSSYLLKNSFKCKRIFWILLQLSLISFWIHLQYHLTNNDKLQQYSLYAQKKHE